MAGVDAVVALPMKVAVAFILFLFLLLLLLLVGRRELGGRQPQCVYVCVCKYIVLCRAILPSLGRRDTAGTLDATTTTRRDTTQHDEKVRSWITIPVCILDFSFLLRFYSGSVLKDRRETWKKQWRCSQN